MDILSCITRWIGSKGTEMHHYIDQWAQALKAKGHDQKLGQSLSSKALSLTGLGLGLSPTTTHPEGGVLGFLKYLPTSGTSVSSDSMVSHTLPTVTSDENKQARQPVCGSLPPNFAGMKGQIPNLQSAIGGETKPTRFQLQPPRPYFAQQFQPTCSEPPHQFTPMCQPSHMGAGGGSQPLSLQAGCIQDRAMLSMIGQAFVQPRGSEGCNTPMGGIWTGVKGSGAPQGPMSCYGNIQQLPNPGWSPLYPHSMQVPRARPPCYQQAVLQHRARPPPPPTNIASNGAMQYYPPNNYPANATFYDDQPQIPQQGRYLPVGTPYVLCQTGSSPYMSIIPLQSVQIMLPAHLYTGSPQSSPSQRHTSNVSPVRKEVHHMQQKVFVSPCGPQEQAGEETTGPSPGGTEPTEEVVPVQLTSPKENSSDDVEGGASSSLDITPSGSEISVVSDSPENSNCDIKCSASLAQEVEPVSDASYLNRSPCQNQKNGGKIWREKVGCKPVNLTPAPRKKKKSRPSAEKRRRRRTPTKCFLVSQKDTQQRKGNKIPDPESHKTNPDSQSLSSGDPKACLTQCMSATVAFVLGLDVDSEKVEEAEGRGGSPPTTLERCNFSISPCDSDSDLDNFFDDSSDSEKGNDEAPDFDFFDFCSDPHNPLNCNSFSSPPEPLKKSSSAPQLECLADSSGPSSLLAQSSATGKIPSPRKRQVKFASDEDLVTVHLLEEDTEACQEARKGHWELYAVDRYRFQNRIQDVENKIAYIFNEEHRQSILKKLKSYE